jgi:hypothetical protein
MVRSPTAPSEMITLALQLVGALLYLPLGPLMLRVAAHETPMDDERHRLAWWILGSGFCVMAVHGLAQNAWAAWAFHHGLGSAVWDRYLAWMAVLNHGRAGVLLGTSVGLLWLLVVSSASPQSLRRRAVVVMLVGLALGSALGWLEGPVSNEARPHYYVQALLNAGEYALLIGIVGYGALSRAFDRLFTLVLAIYVTFLALNVGFWTVLALLDITGLPLQPAHVHGVYRIVMVLTLLSLTLYRLRQARRGVVVPALLARARASRLSYLG